MNWRRLFGQDEPDDPNTRFANRDAEHRLNRVSTNLNEANEEIKSLVELLRQRYKEEGGNAGASK